jgi:phosphoglycolate phosphatase
MGIRAVAVDVDGTVTDMKRRLTWSGVEALRRVEAQGIPVLAATGNVMPVAKAFSSFCGFSGPLVCENGGAVYSPDARRKRLLFDRKRGDKAVEHLRNLGMDVRLLWSDTWRESEVALELNLDAQEVASALEGWGLSVVATRFAIHLMEPGLHKGAGLEAAMGFMEGGVTLKDVLAIGDARNDVEMFRLCGASAAVGNATPEAKEAAQFVAEGIHGDGVAEALRHFGLLDAA